MESVRPIPAFFVEVVCGHQLPGPPLKVDLEKLSKEQLVSQTDTSKDAIVVFLEDCEMTVAEKTPLELETIIEEKGTGETPKSNRGFCFRKDHARALCINLLYVLAHCGERVAGKIVEHLGEIQTELEIEDSASGSWENER